MTFHFPDEIDVNVLTIEANDPKSGTAEFKASAIRVEKLPDAITPDRGPLTHGSSIPRGRSPRWPKCKRSTPYSASLSSPRAGGDEHGGAPPRRQPAPPKLLAALHALQNRVGWISPGGLGELSRRLDIPPAEAYGVASFYAMFAMSEQPPRIAHVCADLACQTRGAGELLDAVQAECGEPNQVGGGAAWKPSPCLGSVRTCASGVGHRSRGSPS